VTCILPSTPQRETKNGKREAQERAHDNVLLGVSAGVWKGESAADLRRATKRDTVGETKKKKKKKKTEKKKKKKKNERKKKNKKKKNHPCK